MITIIFRRIMNVFKLAIFKITWRKINKNNFTNAGNIFPIEKVSVGKKTYGTLYVNTFGNSDEKLSIGSYCSIAGDVKFLLGGEHSYKKLSTYPFKKYICGLKENTLTKGPIVVKDDVWIGQNCLILSGVTIGQGVVIAAGSIVSKDIPPYAIYAGGKIIKYRFSEDIIKQLIKINFENFNEELIEDNIDTLYIDFNIDMTNDKFFKNLLCDRSKVDE